MYHLNKRIIHILIWASALMTKSETRRRYFREALGSYPHSLPYQAPQQLKPQKQKSHLTCVDPSERPPGAEVRTPNHCRHDFLVILLTHMSPESSLASAFWNLGVPASRNGILCVNPLNLLSDASSLCGFVPLSSMIL